MANGMFQKWLKEENLTLLRGWARNGLTDEQIAYNMGIATGTLYRWKNEHSEIREALKESKEIADLAIENALYNKALAGDTTAMIFWLKNRKSNEWRDKQVVDANVDSSINIKVNIDDNI